MKEKITPASRETIGARWKSVTKAELGLALNVPEGWSEFPPVLANSPYEVARFAFCDHADHLCILFRMPGSPGLDPHVTATRARAKQEKKGYENFSLERVDVGGRPGALLSFDKTSDAGTWTAREYFVTVGSLVYCLGLGSSDGPADAATFDAMAASLRVEAEKPPLAAE